MEDYLKKFGMTPADVGIEYYLKNSGRASTEREKSGNNTATTVSRKFGKTPLDELPLAMAYVPFQCIEGVYEQDEALMAGTLFPNLDKPFLGKRI